MTEEMTNEEIKELLKEAWEKDGGKTIEIPEGTPTFDASGFIESLSYSNTRTEPEYKTVPTEAGQKAAAEALQVIRDRSFAGRHPELGKMLNCKFCGTRHRENWVRVCKQTFSTQNRQGDPVQGELVPPDGMTKLTIKQIVGAAAFAKKRIRPHSNRWLATRSNKLAAEQRKKEK